MQPNASRVLRAYSAKSWTSDRAIPQDLLQKAECIVIVPGMKKGAFHRWRELRPRIRFVPKGESAGLRLPRFAWKAAAFGFQIGGSETDVVMLVLNKRGADKLMSSKFTIGGDASVAAGPVGRTSTAETDALLHAEMLELVAKPRRFRRNLA